MISFAESLFGDGSSSASSTLPAFFALFTVIPILLVISAGPVTVMANQDFTVHRVQHLDFQGAARGCRSSLMNLEAKTPRQFSESFARKCVVLRLSDVVTTANAFENLLGQTVAGGILILLPPGGTPKLTVDEEDVLLQLEKTMSTSTVQIPIYFAVETPELTSIYEEIDNTRWTNKESNVSGTQQLLSSVFANGYQMVVGGNQAAPLQNIVMTNIQVITGKQQ